MPYTAPKEILVDIRELRSGLAARLRSLGAFDVREEVLPCGDVAVGRHLIERKTIPDLVMSLSQGRLFRQLFALRGCHGVFPLLLIEGRTPRELEETSPGIVRKLSFIASVRYGIPVIRSAGLEDSARLICDIAAHGPAKVERTFVRTLPVKPTESDKRQLYVLASLPGIGFAKASRLLSTFGSVKAVFNASADELSAVEGIGEVQAATIALLSDPANAPRPLTPPPPEAAHESTRSSDSGPSQPRSS